MQSSGRRRGHGIMAWHKLSTTWNATEADLQRGKAVLNVPPAWLFMLIGDGSPTRQLRFVSG